MHSSTSSFDRPVPQLAWRSILIATVAIIVVATIAWEICCRAAGYGPTLNDTSDLWADRREKAVGDALVVIGDSRALFDVDLDELEKGFGKRPIQLALVGSCAYPVLEDLANDEKFHGTVVASLLPAIWLAPAGPPLENSRTALKRYHTRTVAQRMGHHLGMFLEEHIAFLKQDDLTLEELLKELPIANRPHAQVGPKLPPYFSTLDRERQCRMTESAAKPGPLQERIRTGWIPLFTPPPPPSLVPPEAFAAFMKNAIETRFRNTAESVAKIRARGGRVVFVRFPFNGPLAEIEEKLAPRAQVYEGLVATSGAPAVHFADHPELASFTCPEWSHLSASDATEFTKRLVPHLQAALAK